MKPRHFALTGTPASGFSLIELMIALAIAAILAAIAIPMYQKQVQKSRRTDARTAVLDLAGREERYLSVQASYTNVPANLGYAPVGSAATFPITIGSGYYQLTVTVPAVVAPNSPTYVVSALAIAARSSKTCNASTSASTTLACSSHRPPVPAAPIPRQPAGSECRRRRVTTTGGPYMMLCSTGEARHARQAQHFPDRPDGLRQDRGR